ncbi:hypothetical protein C2G38_2262364 [Gigaspora rosea]|uniref:MD-2-related lipid-recognition domain-containing protein n=1 Tax=Gigaspora rosea TaxID=44941 RepID=A0A397ULN2_9GLOM|nr:hypothetical protein C2G38_2262364 [Gigaspora rosea]
MNGNLIFVTIFLLLTLPFMVNGNDGWSPCSIVSLDLDIINVQWGPDPVSGAILQATVSQKITNATTSNSAIIFGFTDDFGRIIGDTMHPLQPGITNIESSYNVIVPKLLPPSYKFSVAIFDSELDTASNCILFNR